MPLFLAKTGRNRRLRMLGSGQFLHQNNNTPITSGGWPNAHGYLGVQAPWGIAPAGPPGPTAWQIYAATGATSTAFGFCTPSGKLQGAVLQVCDGFSAVKSQDFTSFIPPPAVFTEVISFQYEMYIDVEEWIEVDVLDPALTQFINGNSFPSWTIDLIAQDDGPTATQVRFFELGKAGGVSFADVGFTSSLGHSGSLSSTFTLAGGEELPNGYMAYYEVGNLCQNGTAFTASLNETLWDGLIVPVYSQTRADGFGNIITVLADGSTFSVDCHSVYLQGEAAAVLQSYSSPREDYLLDWRPMSFDQPFPGPVSILVQDKQNSLTPYTAAPEFIGTFLQRTMYSQGSYAFGLGTFPLPQQVIAERCPVFGFIGGATGTLPPIHDDLRDFRLGIRGMPFECGQLTHAPSTPVCAGGSIASPGGSLATTESVWEGYRYLQFSADRAGSINIGVKRFDWTVATPGTPQTVTLDLCSPASDSAVSGGLITVDGRSSRFPLTGPASNQIGNSPDETTPPDLLKGQMFGILAPVTNLVFSGIATGMTLHVGAVSLIRQTKATATFLPSFLPQYPSFTDSGSHPWHGAPMFKAKSDDKLCFDFAAMVSTGAPEGDDFRESIANILAYANAIPGWTYTPAGTYPDAWHNGTNTAYWVWGSGAVWRGGYAGKWFDGIELDATGTLQLYAQPLYDQVQGYPGIGDPWEGTTYGPETAMPVRITKMLRGRASGLVFNSSDGTPAVGATISAYVTADNEPQGSGITNADGAYETGPPFGFGNVDITTAVQPGNTPSDHRSWNNRHEARESFRALPPGCHSPYLLQTENSQLMVSCITSGGDIRFRWSPFTAPPWVNDNVITTGGGWQQAPFCQDHRNRLELRCFHTGGALATGVYRLWSDDNGATWSPPEAVNLAAKQVQIRAGDDGSVIEIVFVPDSAYPGPGTFSARTRGPGDVSFSSPFVPVDDVGAPLHSDGTGFSFDKAQEGPDRWSLTMVAVGDSDASVWYSADGAVSWLRG